MELEDNIRQIVREEISNALAIISDTSVLVKYREFYKLDK